LCITNNKLTYALFPHPDCLFIEADTDKVLQHLQCMNFEEVIRKSEVIGTLSKINLFRNLPKSKLSILSTMIRLEKFKSGQKIINEGEKGYKFYIIKVGNVNIYSKGIYLRTLNPKDCFGERALLTNELRSATVISKGYSELYSLNKEDFLNNIEDNMKQFLFNRLLLQDNSIELNDLYHIKELGNGNYGKVSLVYCRKNSFFYAIKTIQKKQILYEKLTSNLDLEKNILLSIDNPFIVKLVKCLKDNNNIYLLMEYLKGKELFYIIRDIGLLNKRQALFYTASMMLAINYLHKRKFIYRDLKPENLMVLSNGYLKLIDFGTVKNIIDRTSTIIGTPQYMAPEVILGEGYSFQIDFWSIAICAYEFICGGVPFGENFDDPMKIYNSIINDQLNFPNFCYDKEFMVLMKQMLEKNPMKRLSKFEGITKHLWFNCFNWEELISLNMKPPYVPFIKNLFNIQINDIYIDKNSDGIFMNVKNKNFPTFSEKFCDYVNKNYHEYKPEKEVKFSDDDINKFNLWYENF
jgi:cGMP-dependent protein kinase